ERAALANAERNDGGFDLSRVVGSAGRAVSIASNYTAGALRKTRGSSARCMAQTEATYDAGLNRVLDGQPLIVPLAGLAAGAAVAALFPKTDFEKQTLGPVGEQIT